MRRLEEALAAAQADAKAARYVTAEAAARERRCTALLRVAESHIEEAISGREEAVSKAEELRIHLAAAKRELDDERTLRSHLQSLLATSSVGSVAAAAGAAAASGSVGRAHPRAADGGSAYRAAAAAGTADSQAMRDQLDSFRVRRLAALYLPLSPPPALAPAAAVAGV